MTPYIYIRTHAQSMKKTLYMQSIALLYPAHVNAILSIGMKKIKPAVLHCLIKEIVIF